MLNKIKSATFPFYPLIIGVYAVLLLWSVNLGQIVPQVTIRSFIAALIVSLVTYLVCVLLVRDRNKAALISGWILLAVFFYGHIFSIIDGIKLGGFVIGRHRFMVPILGIITIIVVILILRSKRNLSTLSKSLNLIFPLMIVIAAVPVIIFEIRYDNILYGENLGQAHDSGLVNGNLNGKIADKPDVYYFILDGYTRSDVLSDEYGYDNTAFINQFKTAWILYSRLRFLELLQDICFSCFHL